MKCIKAVVSFPDYNNGEVEFFNLAQVLNISPSLNGNSKILMGAGLYWTVYTDSIEIVELTAENIGDILGGAYN